MQRITSIKYIKEAKRLPNNHEIKGKNFQEVHDL